MRRVRRLALDVVVPPDGTPRAVVVTPCCGARLYRDLAPSLCLMCGQPLVPLATALPAGPEFIPDPTTFPTTRYWS